MRKSLTIVLCLCATFSFSQGGGQKWSLSGNAASANDFIGTTNSAPLILKTNNTERMRIRPDGSFSFSSLNNPGGTAGLLQLSSQGDASRLNYTGATNDVLTGAGTFSNVSLLTGFTLNGSNVVTNFNLGVGVAVPAAKLHVIGDAIVDGTIYTSVLEAKKYIKAGPASLYLGGGTTPLGSNENYIFTTSGSLRINGNESSVNPNWVSLENTEINPDGGVATVGFPTADIHGPDAGQIGQIHLMAKDFMMISGTNPTLTFKQTYSTTTPSTNVNGEMAIEFINVTSGPNQIRGINFWKPFPNTDGFDNYLFFVGTNGNVGIGTGTPVHKLDVCGTIRSKEVFVEVGWCDYVFDEKYKLKSLYEVEDYIKKNHHLPGIAPATEIESNGLKLAEMSAKHMEKIEELTLYIIEQQKQLDALKKEIDALKK